MFQTPFEMMGNFLIRAYQVRIIPWSHHKGILTSPLNLWAPSFLLGCNPYEQKQTENMINDFILNSVSNSSSPPERAF